MKKTKHFISDLIFVFKRGFKNLFSKDETPFMLNQKYLRKYSGCKRYNKNGRI